MDEKEILKERFKSAISSAIKAISENFDLQIKFDNNADSNKNSINLPEVANLKNLQDFTNLRAFADSEALKIKYTNKKIYLQNEPKGTVAKTLYSIAEKIRYEKIGSDKLLGIKNNITQCYENKFKNKKIEEIKTESDVLITDAFELYLRNHFFKIKQNEVTKRTLSYWKDLFDKNFKIKLKKLDNCVTNQKEFGEIISKIIDSLNFDDSKNREKEEENDTTKDNQLSEDNDKNDKTENNKDKENEQDISELSVLDSDIDSINENEDLEKKQINESKYDPNFLEKNNKVSLKDKYKIFTNEYDEVKQADDLEKI